MLRSLPACSIFCLLFGWLACSSDDSSATSVYGPVFPAEAGVAEATGGSAGYDSGSDVEGSADAGDAADGSTQTLAPRSTPCSPLDVVPLSESTPGSNLRSLALTETRVYIGQKSGLIAFTRAGGCAGARVTSWTGPEIAKGPVVALARGVGDSLLVGRADGLFLLSPEGDLLAECLGRAVTGLDSVVSGEQGRGVAILGSRELATVAFDGQSCTAAPVELPSDVLAVLGVVLDARSPDAFVIAAERSVSAQPVLLGVPGLSELTGPCSVLGVAPAARAVAVLDPACAAVRFLDLEAQRETYRHTISTPLLGRAIAIVPGSLGTEVTLGAVSTADGTSSLWVLGTSLPQ